MFLTYLMFAVALCLSAVAAFYSIAGLAAIFAAAVIPIVIMGSILEAAKLVVTVWLHEYWDRCRLAMKLYLVPAVFFLMVITSMGIFGFLSKAHLDQAVPTGDVAAKVQFIDEKIKTEKDNIEAARRALRQMDESVDQTMSRSNDEKGADKAAQLRRGQARERGVLQNDIATAQKKIATLNEERAPIATELRKVEAEVGPIKYIAALIYDDTTDVDMLEKAVRWVIILLVIVFDPLAIMMLLAATESLKWERAQPAIPKKEENTGDASKLDDNVEPDAKDMDGLDNGADIKLQPAVEPVDIPITQWGGQDLVNYIQPKTHPVEEPHPEEFDDETDAEKRARRTWKELNPDDTIHRQKQLLDQGKINQLPWEELMTAQADDVAPFTDVNFGTKFPGNPNRGDAYIRVDYLPTKLFKWNGVKWIEIDKNATDTFAYNDEYIDHLIVKIGSGEYDPDLLNPGEREQIEQRLRDNNNSTGKQ
jgi:hypothetical protein